MFNDLFSKTWIRQYLEQQECDSRSKYIKSTEKTFIFPYTMHTGFVKQTTNGITSQKDSPENSINFTESFNGREGLIAQWDNAIKFGTCYLPEVVSHETITKNNGTQDHSIESFATWYQSNSERFLQLSESYFSVDISYYKNGDLVYKYAGDNNWTNETGTLTTNDILTDIINGGTGVIYVVDSHKKNMSVYEYYEKWFTKGDYFMASINTQQMGANFDSAPGSSYMGDITQWELVHKVSLLTTKEITKKDLFKLYLIPQHNDSDVADDNVFYYINNCTKYFDPMGKYVYSELEFASINDSLATTGQIIKGTIMLGAPGEGYAIPKLLFDKNGDVYDFEVNENYTGDQGVRTLQVELLGPAMITGVCAYGRPIEESGKVNKVYPPRRLFLQDLKFPVADNMTTNSNPETTFIAGISKPMIESYYKDWKEARSSSFTESIKKTFDGYFANPDTNGDDYIASNPKEMDLRRTDWLLTKVGGARDLSTVASSYYSALNSDGSNYIGTKNLNPQNIDTHRAHDFLNHMAMIFEQFPTMPIDNYQTYAWTLSQIPLIGGFLSSITLGIPIGWRSQDYFQSDLKWNGLAYLMSYSLFNWYTKTFWGSKSADNSRFPLDAFKNGSEDEVGGIVNSSAMTTAICGNLTDKINMMTYNITDGTSSNVDSVYSSLYINQKLINENGVEVRPLVNNASFANNATTENAITDIVGNGKYLIDAVEFIGVAKMPIRLTTFSTDPDKTEDPFSAVNWQTTLQTKAMLTGNIRDIGMVFKTSYFGDENFVASVNFPFPNNQGGTNRPNDSFDPITGESGAAASKWIDINDKHSGCIKPFTEPKQFLNYEHQEFDLTIGDSEGDVETSESFSVVLHDFKKDGFEDVLQVQYAYGAVEINNSVLSFGGYAKVYENKSFNYTYRSDGEWAPQILPIYFTNFAKLDDTLNFSEPKTQTFLSYDIVDIIKGGINIFDAELTHTFKATYGNFDIKTRASCSLLFNKDNLTLEMRGTCFSKQIKKVVGDSWEMSMENVWHPTDGHALYSVKVTCYATNVSAIVGNCTTAINVNDLTIQPRDHKSKAIKIKNIEIKKGK